MKRETVECKNALHFVVREAFAPEILTDNEIEGHLKVRNFSYLYWEKGVYSIGDVIRIRRKMQCMTRKELCEGICAEKTLIAIENKQRTPQEEIRKALFVRLNLPAEYQRKYHYISEDTDLLELDEKLTKSINEKEWEKASFLLEILVKKLDVDILVNKQFALRTRTLIEWKQGKISRETMMARHREILACTLNYEDMFGWSESYLTSMELLCVYDLMVALPNKDKQEFLEFFLKYFSTYEENRNVYLHISEYELVLAHIASALGNIGDFTTSSQLERKNMKECLRCYRMNMFHMNVYGIWWNMDQHQIGSTEKNHVYTRKTWLKCCIDLAKLCGDTFYEEKYNDKLINC